MKICAAQLKSVNGDFETGLARHLDMIRKASDEGADLIVFPELSLTGYEPTLAAKLCVDPGDGRLSPLEQLCQSLGISAAVGAPVSMSYGIVIGMFIFQPGCRQQLYSKRFLHSDETPFFVPGRENPALVIDDIRVSPAICYEISVNTHAEEAASENAGLYMVSVAKTQAGTETAHRQLSEIAGKYMFPVIMSASVGLSDHFTGAGRSAYWNRNGVICGILDDHREGLLLADTRTDTTQTLFM